VDHDGNAVSNTYTLNFSYGLGLVAEGTASFSTMSWMISLQSQGLRMLWIDRWRCQCAGTRKRPLSSMAPAMVFRDGELELVTGSPAVQGS